MELIGKYIESFEHYKLVVKEKVSDERFRTELIDAFIGNIIIDSGLAEYEILTRHNNQYRLYTRSTVNRSLNYKEL